MPVIECIVVEIPIAPYPEEVVDFSFFLPFLLSFFLFLLTFALFPYRKDVSNIQRGLRRAAILLSASNNSLVSARFLMGLLLCHHSCLDIYLVGELRRECP